VNAYEVKARMVCLQCKNCVIHTLRFRGELLTMGRYTNLSSFYYCCSVVAAAATITTTSATTYNNNAISTGLPSILLNP